MASTWTTITLNTTTYAYAASGNNELQSMTDYNGTTTFTYDDWGRTATEVKNGVTKTYSWTMANMLAGVDSDDVNDTDVAYTYRGDLKRVWRWEDGNVLTNYNWGAGFNVVSEEDVGTPNTLARTYIAGLAEIIGSNPAAGTPRYLTHDHLGSTRGVFSGSKASLGTFEYTPYGNPYAFTGPGDITQLFTGHDLDPLTGNYFAPFRYLNPDAGRWLKMDPLGMIDGPNMYGYVGGNPINYTDPDGLFIGIATVCLVIGAVAIYGLGVAAYDSYYGAQGTSNALNNPSRAISTNDAWKAGVGTVLQLGSGAQGLAPGPRFPGYRPRVGGNIPQVNPGSAVYPGTTRQHAAPHDSFGTGTVVPSNFTP